MAAAAAVGITRFSSSPPLSSQIEKKSKFFPATQRSSVSNLLSLKKMKPVVCFSLKSDKIDEENATRSTSDSFPSPDDGDYLLKLVAGSVGGGAAIKYGSILFPDLTQPNILQALLMISLPDMVAVVILIKESMTESQSKDVF